MLNLNLLQSNSSLNETPIKRGKNADLQPHTAESDQPALLSLEDIDPHDLFQKFNELVRVTVDEEPIVDDFQPEVERKLDYENIHTIKLDFEPSSSSMKKKSKYGESARRPSFRAINLFEVMSKAEEEQSKQICQIVAKIFRTPQHKEIKQRHDLSRAAFKQRQQI